METSKRKKSLSNHLSGPELIGIFHLKLLTDLALVSFPNATTNILPGVEVLQLLNPLIGNQIKIIH